MANTVNTEFSFVEVCFTDQASNKLEIEDNVNLALIIWIDIIKMRYSTKPRFRKYVKGYGILSFARRFCDKYGKKVMDTATKTGIYAAKTASKRVVQKFGKATEDFIGKKIADKIYLIGKPKEKEKTNKAEEIYISPENLDDLRLL